MIDLTKTLNASMEVYPGDFQFKIIENNPVRFIDDRIHSAYQIFTMKNHNGTHIDFPAHKILGGKTSSDFTLNYFINRALLLDSRNNLILPNLSFIEKNKISAILIWTGQLIASLNVQIVDFLCKMPSLKLIGTDALTVDNYKENTVHLKLLQKDILIVEGLCNLDKISQKFNKEPFMFFSIPLPLEKSDGSPVRAFVDSII